MTTPMQPTSPTPPAGSGRAIIQVKDLAMAYDGRTVFSGVTFDVAAGEIVVIGGGSGCGKSTLLKSIFGLNRPTAGAVLIDGDDITGSYGRARDPILRKFGVAFQGGALFGNMTVLGNVRLPMEEFTSLTPEMMNMIALAKLKLVGLEQAAQKLPSELSGGMQKRAAIARALAMDPEIVFLDEPSAGLDPVTSAELDQLILRLNRLLRMTFVIVTHELPSIFTIAHRVVMLDAKKKTVIAIGPPDELRDRHPNPTVHAFFNREPESVREPARST